MKGGKKKINSLLRWYARALIDYLRTMFASHINLIIILIDLINKPAYIKLLLKLLAARILFLLRTLLYVNKHG